MMFTAINTKMKSTVTVIIITIVTMMNLWHGIDATVADVLFVPINLMQLPDGFEIGFSSFGLSLKWSSSEIQMRIGDARPEFHISGDVFGYPQEINDHLLLPITSSQKERLGSEGMKLEVWKSGKRIDLLAPTAPSGRKTFRAAQAVDESGGYDSQPPTTPVINVNPANMGNFATRRLLYNLPSINITNYPESVEVLAEVNQPIGVSSKSALVLFLHGRTPPCYKDGPAGILDANWPCLDGFLPIPSYEGYRYIGEKLASQGYIVVSISANGINGQDGTQSDFGVAARSILIRHHLNLLSRWNSVGGDPWNNALRGKINMNEVVLVGHSRGGEGINRAAIDANAADPFKIIGLVSYGPTAFGEQVTPDVHSLIILPTCDGDISDLQGQIYVDRSRYIANSDALRTAVIALGANHNFFNTEWTPGLSVAPSVDDWSLFFDPLDPVCGSNGSLRLTPQEQQNVGATYTAAFVRMVVQQDRNMLPLLDGSFVRPSAIGRAEVAVNAVGGDKYRLLYHPDASTATLRNGMNGFTCGGSSFIPPQGYSTPRCGADFGTGLFDFNSPHFLPFIGPPPLGYEMSWSSSTGAVAQFNLPNDKANLIPYDWINVRIANDPNKPPVQFDILLTDRRGKHVTLALDLATVDGWPGAGSIDRIHARTFRARLPSKLLKPLVDLSQIASVSFVSKTASGRIWLLDISTMRDRIGKPVILNLPVVSLETVTVREGSMGGQALVNVTITPTPTGPGEVWMRRRSTAELIQFNITAGSGPLLAQFSLSWVGNDVFDLLSPAREFTLLATKGVVTGNYRGGLTVIDDDPIPILSAVATDVTTDEGDFLRWILQLSAPSASPLDYFFFAVPPISGNELFSDDVDESWLSQNSFAFPFPTDPQPLSTLVVVPAVTFLPGETVVEFLVPTTADNIIEGNEVIRFQMFSSFTTRFQPAVFLTGTVIGQN